MAIILPFLLIAAPFALISHFLFPSHQQRRILLRFVSPGGGAGVNISASWQSAAGLPRFVSLGAPVS